MDKTETTITNTEADKPQPAHVKKSQYALGFLNNELQRLVNLKNNVAFLQALKTRVTLTHNDSQWKQIHQALSGKQDEVKDCELSVKTSKEVYDAIVQEESEGKWL